MSDRKSRKLLDTLLDQFNRVVHEVKLSNGKVMVIEEWNGELHIKYNNYICKISNVGLTVLQGGLEKFILEELTVGIANGLKNKNYSEKN